MSMREGSKILKKEELVKFTTELVLHEIKQGLLVENRTALKECVRRCSITVAEVVYLAEEEFE